MLFNSLSFLYVFLPATYIVFWKLRGKNHRYIWLTVTGYIFYAFWNYKFCSLLAFSTTISYLAGIGLIRWNDRARRKLCMLVPIILDLSILVFFKYVDFGLDVIKKLVSWGGIDLAVEPFNILLPIGISFYTFHNISYIIDSYRRTITPTRNFWEYACYVSLFSQLVAGPIIRFREIEKDLEHIDRGNRLEFLNRGWSFFAIGLIQKILIADSIASIINPALQRYTELSTADVWLCMLGYSYQLYFDFCGYSHMAVGLGQMFGLQIPQNFNSPYQAINIADFWRRWHISLFSCLRDYVYIPLGGNRGPLWQTNRNLMITMLLGGLWHGANWTFILWGAYHGLLLASYRSIGSYWDKLPTVVSRGGTFFLVLLGWVLFRADNVGMAWFLIQRMFLFEGQASLVGARTLVALLAIAAIAAHFGPNAFQLHHRWRIIPAFGLVSLFLLSLFSIYASQPTPFLYFQF